eukprot:6200670-Pleurochrysis_carterae.AAC.3
MPSMAGRELTVSPLPPPPPRCRCARSFVAQPRRAACSAYMRVFSRVRGVCATLSAVCTARTAWPLRLHGAPCLLKEDERGTVFACVLLRSCSSWTSHYPEKLDPARRVSCI